MVQLHDLVKVVRHLLAPGALGAVIEVVNHGAVTAYKGARCGRYCFEVAESFGSLSIAIIVHLKSLW